MNKRLKQLLTILLSISVVFAFSSITAFADGDDNTVDKVLVAIGELSNDPRDFTESDIDRVEAIQADYEALSAEDQATVDSTFNHPSGDGQSYGRVLEAAVWAVRSYGTDTSTALKSDTYTTTTEPAVSSQSSKGKSDSSRVRNWWVESVTVENGKATAKIYVTSGAATESKLTSYPSVWAGGQTINRDADNNYAIPVDLNGTTYFGGVSSSMPRPIMYSLDTTIEEPLELTITNKTDMFKAVTASLQKEDEKTYLVMALSGSGYHELFKGTYEAAVANGDGSADKGNDSWIHGYKNGDGKWEFKIPVENGETYIPLVAVSDSYYSKYLNGQNALARAFYPRYVTVDPDAKTLETGDYAFTSALTVTNNVKMFSVAGAALDTVGGPNSNNYKCNLALTMGSDSFDKAYVGRADEIKDGTATIAIGEDKTFALPVKWVETFGDPETLKSLLDGPFVVSFHSVKKDAWYEREFTVAETDKTLVINKVDADYSQVDTALATVPADLSIYTDASKKAVEDAVAAVVRGKTSEEQAEVDAMAEAINNAVSKLVTKEAQAKADADKAAADKAAADKAAADKAAADKAAADKAAADKAAADKAAADKAAAAKALSDAKAAANKDIKAAGKLNTSVYTKKDAQAVKSALNNLKKVVKDKNTTVKKIQTAQKKLKNAITKAKNNKKIADKVKKAKVQKLTVTPGKKKITVSWKKNKTFKGYQVYYKQAGAKKATTKKVTSTKKVFKKLKTGKKYTVKVRGYKSVNGTVYYGKWTAKKTVTVQ